MNKQLLENNYIVIKDFISKDRAAELYNHVKEGYQKAPYEFITDPQAPLSVGMPDVDLFVELLVEKCAFMKEFMGEPMLPTYSYFRFYANNEILKRHTDRPACEVSVTLHLNGDKEWPIWFVKPDGEEVSVVLEPGQAIIYFGLVEHWRNRYEGNEYTQVFLHYVRARGENRWAYFDKRR